MKLKTILISGLLASVFANLTLASGDHGDHNMNMSNHQNMKMQHHELKKTGVSAVGHPAKGMTITKTILVSTLDTMRYQFFQHPSLQTGDVVRFVVSNPGKVKHEFSIGNAAEQKSHRNMMRAMPNMNHMEGNSITVQPGETKELIWKFMGEKKVVLGCNLPGHFEAGMFTNIQIASAHNHH